MDKDNIEINGEMFYQLTDLLMKLEHDIGLFNNKKDDFGRGREWANIEKTLSRLLLLRKAILNYEDTTDSNPTQ